MGILTGCPYIRPCIALVSPSPHGDLLAYALAKLGLASVRGSSRTFARAGSKELIRVAKLQKTNVTFAVDGPSGPRLEVKPGIFGLSYLLDYPIVYMRVEAPKKYVLSKLWDKPYIPYPFSSISIHFEWGFKALTKDKCRDTALPQELRAKMLKQGQERD